jgi:hypothetical protein
VLHQTSSRRLVCEQLTPQRVRSQYTDVGRRRTALLVCVAGVTFDLSSES